MAQEQYDTSPEPVRPQWVGLKKGRIGHYGMSWGQGHSHGSPSLVHGQHKRHLCLLGDLASPKGGLEKGRTHGSYGQRSALYNNGIPVRKAGQKMSCALTDQEPDHVLQRQQRPQQRTKKGARMTKPTITSSDYRLATFVLIPTTFCFPIAPRPISCVQVIMLALRSRYFGRQPCRRKQGKFFTAEQQSSCRERLPI